MISSMINVFKARRLKSKALENYTTVVNTIENAANRGESGTFVEDDIIGHEIHMRLQKDGFDTSINLNQDNKTWIYWG